MYRVTYMSDGYRVTGYLCLPYGYRMEPEEWAGLLSGYYGAERELSVTEIARPVARETLAPPGPDKWPVFVYCRGGIGNVGKVKTEWLERFSRHGHVVFAPCYRGGEGGEGRDEFGGNEQEDVASAIRFLRSLPFVDRDRVSVMGFSRGSVNAARAAAEMPEETNRLVLWSGVSDLAVTYEERVDLRRMLKRVVGGSPAKSPEAYRSRSPVSYASRIRCPVLVIHGTDDQQVEFSHGLRIFGRLRESGASVEMFTYEGYGHHFPVPVHEEAIRRMFEWIAAGRDKR